MRILVTRPRPDAEAFAATLEAAGHEAVVEPLLEIQPAPPTEPAPDLTAVQALLFTSANGVRALASLSPARDLPAFTVGPTSADAARAAGYANVESADGDVEDLVRLVGDRLRPEDGPLFHAAGKVLAGDLKGALEAAGFEVRRAVLYEARPVSRFSAEALEALRAGRLDGAVFFSPRTALAFDRLLRDSGLASACHRMQAFCLSDAVADRLRDLPWANVRVAPRLDGAALLEQLDAAAQGTGQGMTEGETEPVAEDTNSKAASPALRVIAAFGGIRPMAQKLGLAVSTVQGWRERGAIPDVRRAEIWDAAARHGINLAESDLEAAVEGEAPAPEQRPDAEVIPPGAAQGSPDTMDKGASGGTAPPRSSAATAAGGRRTAGTSAPARRRAKRGPLLSGMALGGALFAAGVLVAVLANSLWLPLVGDTAPAGAPSAAVIERLEALERAVAGRPAPADDDAVETLAIEIERLDDAVSALEAVPEASGVDEPARAAIDNLAANLGQQARRLDELGAAVAATQSLPAEIGLLAKRLAAIESRLEALPRVGPDGRLALPADAAFVLAVAQLRDALRFSTPFARELEAVERLVADDAELIAALQPLHAAAGEGVPTLKVLTDEFPALARRLVVADAGGADEGWLAGVKRRLSNLVTVRPVGKNAAGEGVGAVAARAEAHLDGGDLAGALAELSSLTGKAAEAAADWRTGAQARLQAEVAVNLLTARVIERLAPQSMPVPVKPGQPPPETAPPAEAAPPGEPAPSTDAG